MGGAVDRGRENADVEKRQRGEVNSAKEGKRPVKVNVLLKRVDGAENTGVEKAVLKLCKMHSAKCAKRWRSHGVKTAHGVIEMVN